MVDVNFSWITAVARVTLLRRDGCISQGRLSAVFTAGDMQCLYPIFNGVELSVTNKEFSFVGKQLWCFLGTVVCFAELPHFVVYACVSIIHDALISLILLLR